MPDATLPAARPLIGQVIDGKYRLESVIGEGAMGSVWVATHVHLDQRVALKLILPDHASSETAKTRFQAEAKAAASLRSRFVVQIFDSGITPDGMPYLAMELLKGESLEDRVERLGPLGLADTVTLMAQVARGLSSAHRQRIVHRDLKPANVFLSLSEDGEVVAKILDFGIAKVQGSPTSVSATATGAVVGTPLFMSPEQARGLKAIDHRTDIYALGALTYYTLTGDTVFGGEALGDLILAICTHPLPSLSARSGSLPAAVDRWFHRACAREATERFPSAEDALRELVEASGVDPLHLKAAGVNLDSVHTGAYRLSIASSADDLVGERRPGMAPTVAGGAFSDSGGLGVSGSSGGAPSVADPSLAATTGGGTARTQGLEIAGLPRPRPWLWLALASGAALLVALGWGLSAGRTHEGVGVPAAATESGRSVPQAVSSATSEDQPRAFQAVAPPSATVDSSSTSTATVSAQPPKGGSAKGSLPRPAGSGNSALSGKGDRPVASATSTVRAGATPRVGSDIDVGF